MAFKGVYPALELRPVEFGLFSAAEVTETDEGVTSDHWVRGFSFEFDSRPTLRLCEQNGVDAHVMFDGVGLPRFLEVKSFYIEVEDYHSTFAANNEDRFARVLKQLKAASQKAVERELWNGYVARAEGNANQYLTKPGLANFASETPATAVEHSRGLAFLEHALANSPVGEQGILHMSRDMAAHLGSQWLLMRVEDDPGHFHIETMNGTTVSIGSGNTGDGPLAAVNTAVLNGNSVTLTTDDPHYLTVGETVRVSGLGDPYDGEYEVTHVPTDTTFKYDKTHANVGSDSVEGYAQMVGTNVVKWMYATGPLGVLLGAPEVVNENLAQGYDVGTNQNNLRIKAMRPAAVYFDPSVTYAVKVDIS